ncbi:MAG: two-component system NarL family nitrate/nitrite sensor histidine kinase NarX [bacterium]|nr:MAG: two-component system NarL family nitrate/nitrite sensor histidine kinase NarX [bacterium]KAF0148960.1 MAG: two-component system NarL family nitrate/nitrite sensor histidine kinase NarX [bacterium]KAF0168351.1 MAG: two-component system NarL family nitrate/nitrite sensor histidine kinase NarX [bacterium]TXT22665.1 MAG: two-component system NarL family nitrate/nitrite sensor histidine kinase NarX [bacterium]
MWPKHRLPRQNWNALQNSLLLRIGGAIAAIALLAVLGMSVSGLVAESTQGSGEAINKAGSLRMQSWQMAGLYLAGPLPEHEEVRQRMAESLRRFEATLQSEAILAMLPRAGDTDLATTYRAVWDEWRQRIQPRFATMASGTVMAPDAATRIALLDDMGRFVGQLNRLVQQMEDTTEAKILVMRVVLGAALLLTVLVVLLTVQLIHNHLVQPLRGLQSLADSVGAGDLSARTPHTGDDELGQVGRAFNHMAGDLSRMYEDLEERVRQKTAELTRSNQSLELLYHSIARLHGEPPGKAVYLAVLRDIEQLLGLGPGIICLGEFGAGDGVAVATTMRPGDASPCDHAACLWCHGTDQTRISMASDFHRRLTLPLADAEHQYGVLILDIPDGRQLEAWQVQLLEALSRHIGVAIGAERRGEQNRRVALLEERAVIARELHDSLAQSLAYMKIQVSRLQNALKAEDQRAQADRILLELREGMSGAYRQLRELLTTFRLKMDGQNLASALRQTVDEFAERGELEIDLDINLEGCALTPNEEIHVLHVVREALSNVLNHARAKRAAVRLACLAEGEVEVAVEDDGVGIAKSADLHHYGMTIMEERTRTLSGSIAFTRSAAGGTRVALMFRPASRRGGMAETRIARRT